MEYSERPIEINLEIEEFELDEEIVELLDAFEKKVDLEEKIVFENNVNLEDAIDLQSEATDCCEIQDEDCAYQSDFDENMKSYQSPAERFTEEDGSRARSLSQESYHSQPKSWSEFESETKEWRVSAKF